MCSSGQREYFYCVGEAAERDAVRVMRITPCWDKVKAGAALARELARKLCARWCAKIEFDSPTVEGALSLG
jgi:hypothetical protein